MSLAILFFYLPCLAQKYFVPPTFRGLAYLERQVTVTVTVTVTYFVRRPMTLRLSVARGAMKGVMSARVHRSLNKWIQVWNQLRPSDISGKQSLMTRTLM